jgi:hypothetical protein
MSLYLDTPQNWTPTNPVYLFRVSAWDGTSSNGFKWPAEVGKVVVAPDWDPRKICGYGLHGFHLLSRYDFDVANFHPTNLGYGLLVEADEIVQLQGKVKVPRAKVAFVGSPDAAFAFVQNACGISEEAYSEPALSSAGQKRIISRRRGATLLVKGNYAMATAEEQKSGIYALGDNVSARSLSFMSPVITEGDESLAQTEHEHSPAIALGPHSLALAAHSIAAAMAYACRAESSLLAIVTRSGSIAVATKENGIAVSTSFEGMVQGNHNGCILIATYITFSGDLGRRVGVVGENNLLSGVAYCATRTGWKSCPEESVPFAGETLPSIVTFK